MRRADPPLARLQAEFAAGLFGRGDAVTGWLAAEEAGARPHRFRVYRNNVFAGLIGTLRRNFPVVERLVGAAFFQAMAREFVMAHPPRSPVLLGYGEGFSDHIAQFEPAQGLPYLPDVARLEWLRQAAYHAADVLPMPAAALAAAPADRLGELMLQLHPSAGVVASPYPILSIWETNSRDAEVRRIGPDLPGEAVMVLRPRLEVLLMRLEPGGDAFLAALRRGAGLAEAAADAAASAPAFSLPEMLAACLAAGAFTGFSLEGGLS